MTHERISINDSMQDIVVKMCEGNPGAMGVLMDMLEKGAAIDPDSALSGGLGSILQLDAQGIYGTDIYVLNNDICERNLPHTMAVLRAVQLGLFDASTLKDACGRQDYSGKELIPVGELYAKVKERLPNFDSVENVKGIVI